MPYGDRTGPEGMGPRTGRAAGYCAGYDVAGYMNPAFGGRRRGDAGFGYPYPPAPMPTCEQTATDELAAIRRRSDTWSAK